MMGLVIALLAGAFAWTFVEYLLHRFVFHGTRWGVGASEHRLHHARVEHFAPWWQKGLAAAAAASGLLPLSWLVAGTLPGLCFTVGFIGAYGLYEVLHRRAHTHGPGGPYGRWLRRHHFAHHFTDPGCNHGVTTPLWDGVFGTALPPIRVSVPPQLAMRWLLDADGEMRPVFARDYELRRRR